MKAIIAFAIATLIAAVAPVWATGPIAPASRTVDLANMVEMINRKWIGRTMSDIAGKGKIRSVIVLKNLTSMPADGHAAGIRGIIRTDPKLMARPDKLRKPNGYGDNGAGNFWFDAVIVLENGKTFRIERSDSLGRLTTKKGQAYFKISEKGPNKKRTTTRNSRVNAAVLLAPSKSSD